MSSMPQPTGSLSSQLRALVPSGTACVFRQGEVVFSAGDPGDGFYLVESGSVRISAIVGDNEPRVLATIGPGEFFGEMAVLDDAPRSATASAETDTTALFIDRQQLLSLLAQQPQLALGLIREFSSRMRVSNQKYLDDIIQSERLAAVGRFAGTIVHDFKNPLTVISLATEVAFQEDAPAEFRVRAQKRIVQQVNRISSMLQELIEFTRPASVRPTFQRTALAGFLTPLIEEIVQDIADRQVALVLEDVPAGVDVDIDAPRLARVFHNLINNAVDELRNGGKIFVRAQQSDTEVIVSVQDTGKGIAPEIARALFQPFATHGKTHGTGLGLSICKKIVEEHGGRIWVEGTAGRGATFSFTLPRAK